MPAQRDVVRAIAKAFAAGPADPAATAERLKSVLALGGSTRWLAPFCARLAKAFPRGQPSDFAVRRFIAADDGFASAWAMPDRKIALAAGSLPPAMGEPPAGWAVPPLATLGDLAGWLRLDLAELDWYADPHSLERRVASAKLRHYTYRWLPKRRGGARLIEVPKPNLKALQRQIARGILAGIPPHPAAHGFVAGRSIRTNAEPHCGQAAVLKLDLSDFFPSVTRARAAGLLRRAGYPDPVAQRIAALCTNALPPAARLDAPPGVPRESLDRLRLPHLPQGAPTSPALANLCAFRLDCRLGGLAAAAGARYTRYADDLAFSGDAAFARAAPRFAVKAMAVCLEEGFAPNARKTRLMRRATRQQIAGVVANEKPNLSRRDYDRLKAILHRCARAADPASENRGGHGDFAGHLLGRIAHAAFLNPARGEKLRALFAQIRW
ncbi:MAG: reverse transcriptase family protein [Verrucomicrobiales bacterium]